MVLLHLYTNSSTNCEGRSHLLLHYIQAYNILAHVFHSRFTPHVDEIIGRHLCGLRRNVRKHYTFKSTKDGIQSNKKHRSIPTPFLMPWTKLAKIQIINLPLSSNRYSFPTFLGSQPNNTAVSQL